MQKVNLDDLQGPAYIGWVPSGLIVTLGAEDPPTTVLRSLFRETHYKYIPTGFEVQGAVQANPVPFVSRLFSFTKSYNKSDLRIRFAPMDNVAALVDQLYSKNVILYDQGSELALLCPLINLVVSLVKGYLRANISTARNCSSSTSQSRSLFSPGDPQQSNSKDPLWPYFFCNVYGLDPTPPK
jgi:hypothetical protein